ncbi:hypothetical protein HD806DRAFT_489270 [Xylariaceae sp. AK1471]|nr:hypothetical protein HD806DRAFT_489270 [Xylariaceae sp. AK1471]
MKRYLDPSLDSFKHRLPIESLANASHIDPDHVKDSPSAVTVPPHPSPNRTAFS